MYIRISLQNQRLSFISRMSYTQRHSRPHSTQHYFRIKSKLWSLISCNDHTTLIALLPEPILFVLYDELTWKAEVYLAGWSKSFRVSWDDSRDDNPKFNCDELFDPSTPTFNGSVESLAVGLKTFESVLRPLYLCDDNIGHIGRW